MRSQDGRIMLFNKNTNKVKTYYSYFAWIVILLRSFLLVLGFFYILTYYFYQILGNALLVVKIHQKNTLFLSTITKQYFFNNFYHCSITELSTSIKHIIQISNYTIK